MKRSAGFLLLISLGPAALLWPRLRTFRHEGPVRISRERQGFEARMDFKGGVRVPPALPSGISCGLDGRCVAFAVFELPGEPDAALLSGKPGMLDHHEFSLPGLERYGVTGQTLVVDGVVLWRRSAWPVYGAYLLLAGLPLLVWAVYAVPRRPRPT